MSTNAIGQSLRQARQAIGLSQAALAAQLRVSHRTIVRWESGDYVPPRRYWAAIDRLLRLNIPALLANRIEQRRQ